MDLSTQPQAPKSRRPKGRPTGKPLYRRISEDIRERIHSGEWKPGQILPPRRVLSEELGTTRITLDKAICELVNEGYLYATSGTGTFVSAEVPGTVPPPSASSQRDLRKLGVVLGSGINADPTSPMVDEHVYFGGIFNGIRDALLGSDVSANYLLLDSGGYEKLLERSIDAFVLIAPTLSDLPALRALIDRVPFVAIGISPHMTNGYDLPCVDTDNFGATVDAVNHLLDLGHRDIAIVDLAMTHSNHFDRLCGYQSAMADPRAHQILANECLYPVWDEVAWESCLRKWLNERIRAGQLPTAIIAGDHSMMLTLLRVLREFRLKVPEDISLITFDDPQLLAHLDPPLTAVRQPAHALGLRATRRLLHRFSASDPLIDTAGVELLPCELVVRRSTSHPRA